MFVITLDQIDSRHDVDRAGALVERLNDEFASGLALPADQNAGDEVQALVADAPAALALVLAIARSGHWSIGLGVGAVRMPLPDATRKATGPAFVAAREAVTAAKRAEAHFALHADAARASRFTAAEIEPLLTMLLMLRSRRTDQGWEAIDLLRRGLNQLEAAAELRVTPAAVSQRLKASSWRVEQAATPALVKLLKGLDEAASGTEQ